CQVAHRAAQRPLLRLAWSLAPPAPIPAGQYVNLQRYVASVASSLLTARFRALAWSLMVQVWIRQAQLHATLATCSNCWTPWLASTPVMQPVLNTAMQCRISLVGYAPTSRQLRPN